MIDRLDHLVLTVADIERTVAFYERVLDMRHEVFGQGRSALVFGQQKFNLHQLGHEFEPKALTPTPGAINLCLITSWGMTKVLEHLQQQSVYFRDPDGNLIEVSRYLETR